MVGIPDKPADCESRAFVFMYVAGFITIAAQIVLIRELFSVLRGSDLAIAFTLASWTFLSALGAYAGGPLLAQCSRLRPAWGLILHPVIVVGVLVGVRRWGAGALITFEDYLFIPLWVALPCLLGGALFPWLLNARRLHGSGQAVAHGYAYETLGGMAAGLVLSAYFYAGGGSLPALLAFFVTAATGAAVAGKHRCNGIGSTAGDRQDAVSGHSSGKRPAVWVAAGMPFFALALAATGVFEPFELKTVALRFPEQKVLAHHNSPYGGLTATQRDASVFIYENGIPLPSPDPTMARETLTGLLTQFSAGWHRVLCINAVSRGFGHTLPAFHEAELTCWEQDRHQLEFAQRWRREAAAKPGLEVRFGRSPWHHTKGSFDLVAVVADQPGSLLANKFLTTAFMRDAGQRLSGKGAFVLLLPVAPAFIHPLHARYVASVRKALDACFAHTRILHTDLGYLVFAGSEHPLNRTFSGARLRSRMRIDAAGAAHVREAWLYGTTDVLSPAKEDHPASVPANRVDFPFAYLSHLRFRGHFVESAEGFWDAFLRPKPWPVALVCLGILLVLTRGFDRAYRGTALLFWTSWIMTMTVTYSVYLYQTFVGQAYWLIAVLVAATMAGLFWGARHLPRPVASRWAVLPASAVLALLFQAGPLFRGTGPLLLLALLLLGNLLVAAVLGNLFAVASARNTLRKTGAAAVFGMDLAGAAAGFIAGGVVMAYWFGFNASAVMCAACAALNVLWPRRRV